MPITNILRIGTQGVDMKTHPLFIGNRKLHSAVNLAFEEGRVRTRPGFRYRSLGVTGQFQGACLFTPSLGISSQSFADPLVGLVTVASGTVYLNEAAHGVNSCPITISCSENFASRGEVNVFGAENYLIIQNRNSNTHWWTGNGAAVQSPGMAGDLYWLDGEIQPAQFIPPVVVANIPECDRFPCEFDACTLELSDYTVTGPDTATFLLTNSGTAAAVITSFTATPPEGISFDPPSLTIEAGTDEEVEVTSASLDLQAFGFTLNIANSCGAFVRDMPAQPPAPDCELEILAVVSLTATTAKVTLRNAGVSTISGIQIDPVGSAEWSFTPASPYTLIGSQVVEVHVDGLETELFGLPFAVTSNCDTSGIPGEIPEAETPECELTITGQTMIFDDHGTITIKNTGPSVVAGILIVPDNGNPWVFDPAMPAELDPDEEVTFDVTSPFDMRLLGYKVYSDCAETLTNTTLDYS